MINIAPSTPAIAHIRIVIQLKGMLRANIIFAIIKIIMPKTAFIIILVAVFNILYNTTATIIANINTIISSIGIDAITISLSIIDKFMVLI